MSQNGNGPPRGEDDRRGERLAEEIPLLAMPEQQAELVREAIRERLAGRDTTVRRGSRFWLGLAAGAAGVAGVGVLAFLLLGKGVQLEQADGPGGDFEKLAIAAHQLLREEETPLDLPTSSPAEVRRWLGAAGLTADLAGERPPEDGDRFSLRGASSLPADFPVAAVSYRIDQHPVTLVVTQDAHAPEAPRWGLRGKTLRSSIDHETGARLLTWRNAGKAYSLLCEIPGSCLEACFICHTQPARRESVRKLRDKL